MYSRELTLNSYNGLVFLRLRAKALGLSQEQEHQSLMYHKLYLVIESMIEQILHPQNFPDGSCDLYERS